MKLILFQILTFLVLGSAFAVTTEPIPMHWSDLDIVQQFKLVLGTVFMLVLGVFAAIIFRSVWVRDGYAGVDSVLEGEEVSLFMSHILAFALVEIFFFMVMFYDYTQPPSYVFWICAGGFLSPTVVKALHFVMDRFKK